MNDKLHAWSIYDVNHKISWLVHVDGKGLFTRSSCNLEGTGE